MTSVKLLLPDFTPEAMRAYWSRRDFRKYKSNLVDEMTSSFQKIDYKDI